MPNVRAAASCGGVSALSRTVASSGRVIMADVGAEMRWTPGRFEQIKRPSAGLHYKPALSVFRGPDSPNRLQKISQSHPVFIGFLEMTTAKN